MRSDEVKQGYVRAPNRSLLRALGITDDEMTKPFIGIANSWNTIVPGHLNLRQVARDKPPIAGGPQQHDRGEPPVAEAIENMTADEAARPCEQYLQLDQAEFFAHLPQLVEGEIHLLVGVRCHQADADQLLPGRHRR